MPGPTPAPARFPYTEHRTLAQVDADAASKAPAFPREAYEAVRQEWREYAGSSEVRADRAQLGELLDYLEQTCPKESDVSEHVIGEARQEQCREPHAPRLVDLSVLAARALDAKRNGTKAEAADARTELLGALEAAGLSANMAFLLARENVL